MARRESKVGIRALEKTPRQTKNRSFFLKSESVSRLVVSNSL